MAVLRFSLLLTLVLAAACGGSSPSAPGSVDSPAFALRGETVSAIDGRPIAGVSVKVGAQTAVSDAAGSFDVRNLHEGSETVTLSAPSIVERQKTITIPASGTARETLIPASFDLGAFDEMFRSTGHLQRWTAAPGLVVLAKEMQYESFAAEEEYHATSEQLTEADTTLMIDHLTEGLALLTGNTFTAFSSIEIENPASGARVDTLRSGKIVVGRYRGLQSLANTIGFGRWATNGTSEIIGGAMYLDRNFDRASDARRLLRIHELGHALGYLHVTTRTSVMNPAIGPEPSEFDRQAAIVAFQRMPGNQSPDNDVVGPSRPGGVFGGRTLWSAPVEYALRESSVDSRQSSVVSLSQQSSASVPVSSLGSRLMTEIVDCRTETDDRRLSTDDSRSALLHQRARARTPLECRKDAIDLRRREIERPGYRRLQDGARVQGRLEIAPLEQRAIAEARPVGEHHGPRDMRPDHEAGARRPVIGAARPVRARRSPELRHDDDGGVRPRASPSRCGTPSTLRRAGPSSRSSAPPARP